MRISPVKLNNQKIPLVAGLSVATGLLAGKVVSKRVSDTVDADGVRTIKNELPFYTDLLGVFHKKEMEIKINNANKTRTLTETDIDGSKLTRIFKSGINYNERFCNKVDKDGNVEFFSHHFTNKADGNQTTVINSTDYRTNSQLTSVSVNGKFKESVRKIFNPATGKYTTEILTKSDIPGVLNSKIIDENGKEKIESIGIKYPDGSVKVEKHLVSLDGTKTDYIYKSKPSLNGKSDDTFLSYVITDKNGEILANVERKFIRISDNKVYSSLNGHGYYISQKADGFDITDVTSKKTINAKFLDIVRDEKDLDKETMEFVKTIPADIILKLLDEKIKIYTVPDDDVSSNFDKNIIKTRRFLYTLAHELGHGIDNDDESDELINITNDVLYRKNFDAEKSLFMKNFTDAEQDYISYFLMDMGGVRGADAGVSESVAESHALLTSTPDCLFDVRSFYLQKYFPKSIAAASKLMLKDKFWC